MPTLETIATRALMYQPSSAVAQPAGQPFWINKPAPWRLEPLAPSQTSMIGLESAAAYNRVLSTMRNQTYSSSDLLRPKASQPTLDEALFDAKASAKILISHVSMYLRQGWRDKLFYQLDNLLDPEEWDPDDKPLQKRSFDTFLKAICDLMPTARPGLGVSHSGNLIAAWRSGNSDRISLEFAPDGRVKVIGTRFIDQEPVPFSAQANVGNLKQALIQFNCSTWLGCA